MTEDIDRVASEPEKKSIAARPASTLRSTARAVKRPLRSLAVFGAVGALVAAIALPAFAPSLPAAHATTTLQQLAVDDAQSLIIASEVTAPSVERGTYTATTQEEIDKKKAEEAAARRARLASARGGSVSNVNLAMTAPGSGAVRWPVSGFHYGPRNLFRPPSRPGHNGFDFLAARGTPIYAAHSGTVRVSQESYGGYGVGIVIDGVVGGQRVSTTYGHMIYGSRRVQAGQWVEAGQLIGQVGSTGRSSANHLHLEVRINGGLVDPLAWLNANGG